MVWAFWFFLFLCMDGGCKSRLKKVAIVEVVLVVFLHWWYENFSEVRVATLGEDDSNEIA